MSKYKLEQNEIKDIAHFITRRSLKTETGQPSTTLAEYLETYSSLIDKMEEYNKKIRLVIYLHINRIFCFNIEKYMTK